MRPHLVLIAILGLLSSGASCDGGRRAEAHASSGSANTTASPAPSASAPAAEQVQSIPSVDLGDLASSERRVWVDLVNDLLSPCGEPVSVARCATDGARCRACVPAARYVARLVMEGYPRSEIEEHYRARYASNSRVELTTDGAPVRGAPMAEVTIVEFSDFECPHCAAAQPVMHEIVREFDGRVRLVFKNYPLDGHIRAMPAARAAAAAGRQGKFWEMADHLFEHQTALEDEDITRYARELGLDLTRFAADMQAPELQRRIDGDKAEGRRVGVQGTPTFFINGHKYSEPLTSLAAYLREELDQ